MGGNNIKIYREYWKINILNATIILEGRDITIRTGLLKREQIFKDEEWIETKPLIVNLPYK